MHKQTKNLKKNLTTVLLSLGGMVFFSVVIYALGTLDGVNSASGTSGLAVQGVPNKVEVLEAITFLEDGSNVSGTTLGYSGHTNSSQTGYLHIQGPINMESLVVGSESNTAGTRSAVFGGKNNQASATNSAIAGGTQNQINEGSNSVIAGSQGGRVGSSNQVLLGAVAVEENNSNHISSSTNSVLAAGDRSTLSDTQQTFVAGSGHMVQNTNATVILGKNVNVDSKNQIFVYSNTGTFSPSSPNAFYINAQSGVAVNKTAATTALDIAGELAFADIVSDVPEVDQAVRQAWKGTITLVQKTLPNTREQKIGLCGHNGERWQPLTEVAYEHKLCIPGRLACDKVPVNAHRSNLEDDTCEWACDAGYAEVGNQCVKAQWVQESSQVCDLGNEKVGKQAKKTVKWKCKAGTTPVDVKECNHRRENKQAPSSLNEEVTYVYDENCADSTCELVANDCSGAGMCLGGVNQHQPASCQRKRMTTANTFEIITERGEAVCQRACENGACGSTASTVKMVDDLTPLSPNLCASGNLRDGTPGFNSNGSFFDWRCDAKDSNARCQVLKRRPQDAQCGTVVDSCISGTKSEATPQTGESARWNCITESVGSEAGRSASCFICASGYTKNESGTACVPVKPKCNKCRKDGFPYCFDVDMSPNCDGGEKELTLMWKCQTSSGRGSCYDGRNNAADSLCSSKTSKNECSKYLEVFQSCEGSPDECRGPNGEIIESGRRLREWDSSLNHLIAPAGGGYRFLNNGARGFAFDFKGVCKWLEAPKQLLCVDDLGGLHSEKECESLNLQKPSCSNYQWKVLSHGVCNSRSSFGLEHRLCIPKKSPYDYDGMTRCVGKNPLQCALDEECTISDSDINLKLEDGEVFCIDIENENIVAEDLCDPREKPAPYEYCGDPEDFEAPSLNQCFYKDHTSLSSLSGRWVDYILGPTRYASYIPNSWIDESLAYKQLLVLDIRSSNTPYLYIPISYYVGHPEKGVSARVKIKATISNGVATYVNTVGVYDVKTRSSSYGYDQYLKIPFNKQFYNNYPLRGVPCDINTNCSMRIEDISIDIPDIPTNANGCRY